MYFSIFGFAVLRLFWCSNCFVQVVISSSHRNMYKKGFYGLVSSWNRVTLYAGICTGGDSMRSRTCPGSWKRFLFWKWIRNGNISYSISLVRILDELFLLGLVGDSVDRFRKSLQYLQGLVINNNASTRSWKWILIGCLALSFPLAISIFRCFLGFGSTRVRDNALDEVFVGSDAMLFQQSFDWHCGSLFLLFDIFFDELSKVGVFFSQGLQRLFQFGC